MGADSTVVVPEVFGEHADSIENDVEAAIEYASEQGVPIEEPGAGELDLLELGDADRGYLAIDLDTGYIANPEDLRLLAYSEDFLDQEPRDLVSLAEDDGSSPTISKTVFESKGLDYTPIFEDDED